ncbi:MAG TPA: hypothetical protein PKY25_01950 [Bacilli bacterium]|nr:hypothetical protein [Bacilli bacterium]
MQDNKDKLESSRIRILRRMASIKAKIEKLTGEKIVQEYITQCNNIIKLNNNLDKIEEKIKLETMMNCNHIWIISSFYTLSDGYKNQIYKHYRCIKCGRDTKKFDGIYSDVYCDNMDSERSNYILSKIENELRRGTITDIYCQYETIELLYNQIVRKYPKISNEQAVKYIKRIINLSKSKRISDKEKRLILKEPHKYL